MGLELHYDAGQTPLDEGEKEGLKIKSITTQGELDELEQLNIEKAVEWTIHAKLKPSKILTEKFIKDLHKMMYGDVWKWAGQFRQTEKNIGTKSSLIGLELRQLLDDTLFWVQNEIQSPEEIAIRFKHRIVSIHCFPNGNGRHSRLMADIMIETIFRQEVFTWHQSNMVHGDKTRATYIAALQDADNGNIIPLIAFASNYSANNIRFTLPIAIGTQTLIRFAAANLSRFLCLSYII